MSVNLGAGLISEIRLGATEINQAYLGATLIYDNTGGGGTPGDSGWFDLTAVTEGTGGSAWDQGATFGVPPLVSLDAAGSGDTPGASIISLHGGGASNPVLATFTFTNTEVPAGATINGIEVQIAAGSLVNVAVLSSIRLSKNGTTPTGSDLATAADTWAVQSPPTDYSYVVKGGAAELWGETWLASDFTSGVTAIFTTASSSGDFSGTVLDDVDMRVHYTA